MTIPAPIEHASRAINRLPLILQRPIISALTGALAGAVGEIDELVLRLLAESLVSTAVGEQLNLWGLIVGVSRRGALDPEYRARILQRARENQGSGTIPEILASYRAQTDTEGEVSYFYAHPASYTLLAADTGPIPFAEQERIIRRMLEFSPAGVNVQLVYAETTEFFAFSRGVSTQADADPSEDYTSAAHGFGAPFSSYMPSEPAPVVCALQTVADIGDPLTEVESE